MQCFCREMCIFCIFLFKTTISDYEEHKTFSVAYGILFIFTDRGPLYLVIVCLGLILFNNIVIKLHRERKLQVIAYYEMSALFHP